MRQKLFHSVLFIVLCLAFGGNALAQPIVVNNQSMSKNGAVYQPNIDQSKYNKRTLLNGVEIYEPKTDNASISKAEEADMVTVTCQFVADEEFYLNAGVMEVYNKDLSQLFYPDYSTWPFDENEFVCRVPVGEYDFLAQAVCIKEDGRSNGMAYYVKEQVNIQHDTTLVMDFAEVTCKYEFKYYKPDGSQAQLPVVKYNTGAWDEIPDTISFGNIESFNSTQALLSGDVGQVTLLETMASAEILGHDSWGTIYTNNLSDRYKIGSVIVFNDDDNACIVKYETAPTPEEETVHENKADDYVLYQEKFTPSLANNTGSEGQLGYNLITLVDENFGGTSSFGGGSLSGMLGVKAKNNTTALYVDAPRSTSENIKFDVMLAPLYVDQIICITENFGYYDEDGNFIITFINEYTTNGTMTGLPVLFNSDGSVEYVNAGPGVAKGDWFLNITNPEVSDIRYVLYPGHPHFSYSPNQKVMDYGTSCPINALRNDNMEAGIFFPSKHTRFNCCYVGRYGEVRGVDLYNLQTEIRYNGEIICNNFITEGTDMYNFASQGYPDGEITAHFVNCNMMVDGLQGMNVTDVYFDQRNEDWAAPVLQMLLFKDSEGNIIDRFDTAEEGIIEFAGGDFYPIEVGVGVGEEIAYITWYDCKPQTVEVSYSPYSAEDWTALEVSEIPEEYYMPGFGYFYRGSLKDVTGDGEKGWFDLKIKLTDLSGNWQEQVISPAFRIGDGSLTDIKTVKSDIATEVARYTIDGRTLSAPQTGVNIVKMSDGTVKKVLVK